MSSPGVQRSRGWPILSMAVGNGQCMQRRFSSGVASCRTHVGAGAHHLWILKSRALCTCKCSLCLMGWLRGWWCRVWCCRVSPRFPACSPRPRALTQGASFARWLDKNHPYNNAQDRERSQHGARPGQEKNPEGWSKNFVFGKPPPPPPAPPSPWDHVKKVIVGEDHTGKDGHFGCVAK